MNVVASVVFAYLIGGIPFAQLFASHDLRSVGDKNVGFYNFLSHEHSKLKVALAFLLDLMKGIVPVALFGHPFVSAFFAVIGHVFSPYLNFEGGMGQLTSFGIILYENPIFAFFVYATRYTLAFIFYKFMPKKLGNCISGLVAIAILSASTMFINSTFSAFYGAATALSIGYLKRYYKIKSERWK